GEAAEIVVEDRGPGVAPDEVRRLFEPFFRGRGAVESQAPGSGIGLALVRRIVEAHGGRVEARPLRRGIAFVLRPPAGGAAGSAVLGGGRAGGAAAAVPMLPARGQAADKGLALKLGANEYATKRFDHAELMARIGARLRAHPAAATVARGPLAVHDLTIDWRA